MKKYFIIAAAAVVAMAACSKVDNDDNALDRKISFEVASFASQTTKANTALQDESFEHFYTYANLFQSYADPSVYMNNVEILFDGTGSKNVWAPARDYYWPKNATSFINFYSYVNTKPSGDGNLTPSITFDNATSKTATAAYTDKVIEATDNILLADPALHQTGNLTQYTSISNVTSGVPTLFRHLLAKVNFTVKLQTTEDKKSTNTKFVVTILNSGENLSNLVANQKGSFTATNTDASTAATTGTWTMPNVWTLAQTPVLETISMLTPELTLAVNTTSCDPEPLLAERTVMPQTLSATNVFNLAFRIDTYYGDETTPYMSEVVRFSDAISTLVSTITAWNKNTKITYNIIIDPIASKVTFDPAVEEWATAEGSYNYPPAA